MGSKREVERERTMNNNIDNNNISKRGKVKVSSIRPSFYGYHSELLIKLANKNSITPHTLIVVMAEMLNKQDGNLPRELINEVQEFRPSKGQSTNRRD